MTESGSKRARPKTSKKTGDEAADTARFHCNYCGRDISYTVRARCAECADFDLCLDCFSVGAALDQHIPTHAYRLVEVVTRAVLQEGWGADDEDRLLEGLELYGVGNWEDIAKLIGGRQAVETEAHFMQAYLSSASAPLPNVSRILPTMRSPQAPDDEAVDPKALRVMHLHQLEEVACWMPKRGDFVYEWNNDAEEILADMEMNEEDSKQDRELKIRVLEVYNSKLDERETRKQCVLERGLLEYKDIQAADKKRPKEERDLRDRLRRFARFLPDHAEYLSFLNGLSEERTLRATVDGHREARAFGCTKLSDSPKSGKMRRGEGVQVELLQAGQNRRSRGSGKPGQRAPGGLARSPAAQDDSGGAEDAPDMKELAAHPGGDLLSLRELMLCRSLRMYPHQYLVAKDTLVNECARTGSLKRKDAKLLIKIDQTKVTRLFDYFAACGWISVA